MRRWLKQLFCDHASRQTGSPLMRAWDALTQRIITVEQYRALMPLPMFHHECLLCGKQWDSQ